jgi:hypothetical protein
VELLSKAGGKVRVKRIWPMELPPDVAGCDFLVRCVLYVIGQGEPVSAQKDRQAAV